MNRMLMGHVVQKLTFAQLKKQFPGRFENSTNNGPDIYDKWTRTHVEITTSGQRAAHIRRGTRANSPDTRYLRAMYVLYEFSHIAGK